MSESFTESVVSVGRTSELAALETVFNGLTDQARCIAIEYLAIGDRAVSLDDLVNAVARSLTSDEVASHSRERAMVRFHHLYLPKMDAAGLLDSDQDDRMVEPTEKLDVALQLLTQDADSGLQEPHSDANNPQRTLSFDLASDRSPSVLVTATIADEKGVEVTDLEPLRTAVDINGIRAAIDAVQDNPDGSARISFSFEGYLVTVRGDGTIELSSSS